MPDIFSVAIDGPSGAGKSTLAKSLAQKTGAMYLDTGAMYRAVGLWMLRNGVPVRDMGAVAARAERPEVDIRYADGAQRIFLSEEDVTDAIRTQQVADAASAVSAVPEVRRRLVAMQRKIAAGKSVVMDGRDIGTVVLPNATLKIYLIASARERARRRRLELLARGMDLPIERVEAEIEKRDRDDSSRAASPLRRAEDAVTVDCSLLNAEETLLRILELLSERTGTDK